MTIWYAFKTAPQREFSAEHLLKAKGYKAFVPFEYKYRKGMGKQRQIITRPVKYPMINSYCFAGFDDVAPWLDLSRLTVLTGVVAPHGRPARLTQHDIDCLKRICQALTPHTTGHSPHRAFRVGDRVVVTRGAFAGHSSKVDQVTESTVSMVLDLLGKAHVMAFPVDILEAA